MRKFYLLFLLFSITYSQDCIYNHGFKGYELSTFMTLNNERIYGINYNHAYGNGYIAGISYSYLNAQKSKNDFSSFGVNLNRVFNENEINDKAIFSAYSGVGLSVFKKDRPAGSLSISFGAFKEYKYLIPEISLNYNLLLIRRKVELDQGGEINRYFSYNQFSVGFALTSIIRINEYYIILITPGLAVFEEDRIISIQFSLNLK